VHHGNGTQETFWSDPTVLSISVHQEDLFPPVSGLVGDVGQGDGAGANINIPLPAGAGRAAYLDVLDGVVVPALERFAPEFILVACGFDAAMLDPLGRMNLTSECFAIMTARIAAIAASICQSRLVLCHEGGYSSSYVPYCGLAVIESLAGVRTDVIDPWLTDARQVRELPLRAHERTAIDQAIDHAGL
jgi:acetoin utilization deacetylase AcuC-like enzyme